jgi:hypothetical protein
VRAVNLIPPDQRRGAGGLAGRSGGVVYVLTGGLAVLVAMGVVYAVAVHSVATRKTDLASLTRQVAVVNLETQTLAPYVQVASVAAEKVHEVTSLAQQRFNWPSAMQQLALALPSDVTITSFTGSGAVSSAAPATAATGTAAPATGAPVPATPVTASGPAVVLAGCASTQREVADVLTNLFQIPGVSDVKLLSTVETIPPSKKTRGQTALSSGGGCPLVTWNVGLSYSGSYTVPDTKLPSGSSSTTSPQTAASSHSSGAAK